MDQILRVDMTDLTVKTEPLPDEWTLVGGRGLSARILLNEVNAKCDPLGAENALVLAPGVLSGSVAPTSGRMSVGAKSPRRDAVWFGCRACAATKRRFPSTSAASGSTSADRAAPGSAAATATIASTRAERFMRHSPRNRGARFSMKAAIASIKSLDARNAEFHTDT